MTIALAGLFNDQLVENIVSFYNPCPEAEWAQVCGSTAIPRTTHSVTYGGGVDGGFCYLFREHEPGLCRWDKIGTAGRLMRWFQMASSGKMDYWS